MTRRPFNILGIETSCDETGAAVVRDGRLILSNIVATSLKEHQKFGGIIPEIASRRQLECINSVVAKALHDAGLYWPDIHAIAVTKSPGLIGSLLVGLSYARGLNFAWRKPLIEVNHVEAHLYASFLTLNKKRGECSDHPIPKLPAVGLIVSGGHTNLYSIKNFRKFQLLGQTRDDAAGEAFDKVARILGLGYPGGPAIEKIARRAKPTRLSFPCGDLPRLDDFSFSGLKTAVLYHVQKHKGLTGDDKATIAQAFQESVVSALVNKSLAACQRKKIHTLVIGGGVAANSLLREKLSAAAARQGVAVFFPPFALCVDNAAMVAGYAYHQTK